jgi:hypothetical protein
LTEQKDNAKKAESKAPAEPKAQKFERDQLVADSMTLLSTPPHIVVGALADRQGTGPLTLKEAEAAIDRFLNREVKEN